MPDRAPRRCKNQWGGREYMFHQMLAQHGVIVWVLDNRSASGKGVESQWPVYGRLGELELQDLEDGVAWLKQQPYVDSTRMVLSGWSYGGFMTAYAMTHSTSWSAGIVGAPVTDWRDYDTHLHRTADEAAEEQSRRLSPDRAAIRGRQAARAACCSCTGRWTTTCTCRTRVQFAYELQRAGQAIRDDGVSEVATRDR